MRILVVAWLLLAALGPLLVGDPLAVRTDGVLAPLAAPSPAHWLGTDDVGRDVLARLVHGARLSIGLALAVAALSLLLGAAAAALVAGRRGRGMLLGICDSLAALPPLLLVIAVAGLVGRGGGWVLIPLIAVPRAADTARLALAELERALAAPHAEAARALGAGRARLIHVHALPLAWPVLAAAAATSAATAVLSEAALGFLGLGFAAPTPSWGELLLQAHRNDLPWWLAVPSGLAAAALALTAQRLADRLANPRG